MRWPIKVSIRLSILSITLTLLLGISALIVGINYFVLDSVLIAAADSSLSYASGKVSAQMSSFFSSLNSSASTAFQMLSTDTIKPEYSDEFVRFLYSLIADNLEVCAVYWADIDGNSYGLNRVDNGKYYLEQSALRNRNGDDIERLFDAKGKLLSIRALSELPFDGEDIRSRLWYKQAKQEKRQIWVVYKFLKGSQGGALGVTAAIPLYDFKGDLLGVFGTDMLIETISKYVDDIKITKNSVVFVVDSSGSLIAVHGMGKKLHEGKELPKIESLNLLWLEKSFTIYQQNHKSPFVYSVGNKKYISSYEKIIGIQTIHPWFVSIVTPVDDIIAPLREKDLIADKATFFL
ncbi:MAG: cache domain-containing protein [bacterium]